MKCQFFNICHVFSEQFSIKVWEEIWVSKFCFVQSNSQWGQICFQHTPLFNFCVCCYFEEFGFWTPQKGPTLCFYIGLILAVETVVAFSAFARMWVRNCNWRVFNNSLYDAPSTGRIWAPRRGESHHRGERWRTCTTYARLQASTACPVFFRWAGYWLLHESTSDAGARRWSMSFVAAALRI